MTAPVFYVDQLPTDSDTVVVDGAEGVHAAKVRRLRVGETVRIADAAGGFADCVVSQVGARQISCQIQRRGVESRRTPELTVVQALPKGDRAGLAVELLTEAGVDQIIPWQAANCVSRWVGAVREVQGVEKWKRTAREAAKQSRRARVPEVDVPVSTADLIPMVRMGGTWLVLHESATVVLTDLQLDRTDPVHIVVGPEGGITEGELAGLVQAGATVVRLGPEVLRTSTAGAVAIAAVSVLTGRWS